MKVKNWLYPVLLVVSTLAVAIALFCPLFNYVYNCGLLQNQVWGSYGVFTNFAGLALFPTYIGITGVFASSYLVLAFVGLLLSVVLTILKMTGFEIKQYGLCNKIAAGVALVGTIGFVVSAVTFICINHSLLDLEAFPGAYKAIVGTFPLWLAMGATILGTIASFLGAKDIAEDEITSAPTKLTKQETSSENGGEVIIETNAVIAEEKPKNTKPAQKPAQKKTQKPAQKQTKAKTTQKKTAKK